MSFHRTLCTDGTRSTNNDWRLADDDSAGAATASIATCRGTRITPGIPIYRITITGNVQARRPVTQLRVTGYANDVLMGTDVLDDLSAGQSTDFSIQGILSTSQTTR